MMELHGFPNEEEEGWSGGPMYGRIDEGSPMSNQQEYRQDRIPATSQSIRETQPHQAMETQHHPHQTQSPQTQSPQAQSHQAQTQQAQTQQAQTQEAQTQQAQTQQAKTPYMAEVMAGRETYTPSNSFLPMAPVLLPPSPPSATDRQVYYYPLPSRKEEDDGYFSQLWNRRRSTLKILVLALVVLLAISIHSTTLFYLKLAADRLARVPNAKWWYDVALRVSYPLLVFFIVWNMKVFVSTGGSV
eukprot:gene29445-5791_t